MLTKGDDYPIHQSAEPIAFSGSDRNFYDRYFFCGYQSDGDGYFAASFGVYPHLNVVDAHFSVLRNGIQHCLHTSRLLAMERMDLQVGPIQIEVIEPLQKIRLIVTEHDGIAADLIFEGRSAPVQEPRFARRQGARMFMDLTRFTQNCRVTGWIQVDGKRETYTSGLGTRDRSWGVRPIGAADAQPVVPMTMPQFYWLWTPTNFPNFSLYAHVNEDADGKPWNRRASLVTDGAAQGDHVHLTSDQFTVAWQAGKRHASSAQLMCEDQRISWTPIAAFFMKGIGYGHPKWGHGVWHSELAVEREDFVPGDLDPLLIPNLHIQAVAKAQYDGGGVVAEGIGLVEQLVIGPHIPSGFASINDGAP
jgi:hypothetical protein